MAFSFCSTSRSETVERGFELGLRWERRPYMIPVVAVVAATTWGHSREANPERKTP